MKTINRLLILGILIVILLIVAEFTNFFDSFRGSSKLTVERSEVSFGREIFGNKISIRDNIVISQKGNLFVDGLFLGLGNENKDIELFFLSELGYFVEDITNSERLDSIQHDEIISRSLIVELPLPDTLSFIEMRQEEQSNEWFWEGWYKDSQHSEARKDFMQRMRSNAYNQFSEEYISPDKTKSLFEAAFSVLNFVNNGFAIGNERKFDRIVSTFNVPAGSTVERITISCNADGDCRIEETTVPEFLN